MGHITAAVAALFIRSDRNMVTTRIRPRPTMALPWARWSSMKRAIRSAVPVVSMAPATGIKAASSTTTGQSTVS